MSQIDEAFIQAYATPQRPAVVPLAHQPPAVGLHTGPNIQMPPVQMPPAAQASAETQTVVPGLPAAPKAWAPEPIPAPHFQVPVSQPNLADSQPAAVQERVVGVGAAPTAEAVSPLGVQQPVQHIARPPSPPAIGNSSPPAVGVGSSPAIGRRPLSTFAAPEQPASTAFNPVFEVDGFRWPKLTTELLNEHHELLLPVVDQLIEVSEQGRSLIGIAGTRPNVGCSTLLMCLARLLGSAEKSVAMVDANFSKASLARDLGLEFETGWENVLTGDLPLAECVVKSLEDRMALLPLARPNHSAAQLLESIQTSVTAGVLRYHYDVVFFNLGTAAQSPQDMASFGIMQHCRLDASIIVADTDRTGIEPIDTLMSLFGPTCLGVIGNSAA